MKRLLASILLSIVVFIVPINEVAAAGNVQQYTMENMSGVTGTATATVSLSKSNRYTITVKVRGGIADHQYYVYSYEHFAPGVNPVFLENHYFRTDRSGSGGCTLKAPVTDFYWGDLFIFGQYLCIADEDGLKYQCPIRLDTLQSN